MSRVVSSIFRSLFSSTSNTPPTAETLSVVSEKEMELTVIQGKNFFNAGQSKKNEEVDSSTSQNQKPNLPSEGNLEGGNQCFSTDHSSNSAHHLRNSEQQKSDKISLGTISEFRSFIEKKNLESVNSMIQKFPNIINTYDDTGEICDPNSGTPLIWAICYGNIDVVKLLLAQKDIDVNASGNYIYTPLNASMLGVCNEPRILELLLQHPGIDVKKVDKFGHTPMYAAVGAIGTPRFVELLIKDKNININEIIYGDTILHTFIRRGNIEIVKLLLQHSGIDVTITNDKKETSKQLAVSLLSAAKESEMPIPHIIKIRADIVALFNNE
jgi:ankyrin repeat protein